MNHHKVHLEQYYLVEGMKTAAAFHMNIPNRDEALRKLCDFNAFLRNDIRLPNLNYLFFRPCDDDFVTLMKQTQEKDIFINGWFNRQFLHKPLWKSKMHFFHSFSEVLYNINIPIEEQRQNNSDTYLKKVREKRIEAICDIKCKEFVLNALQLEECDIIQKTVFPKIRKINPNEISVSLGGEIRKFSKLAHDSFTVLGDLSMFCYWYVNLDKIQGGDNAEKRKKVIAEIVKYTQTIF